MSYRERGRQAAVDSKESDALCDRKVMGRLNGTHYRVSNS